MATVEIWVSLDCNECETKVRKALLKLKGVDNVEIDRKKQKVIVTGFVDHKKALKAVRGTGKRAVLLPSNYNALYHFQDQTGPITRMVMKTNMDSYNYQVHGFDEAHLRGYYNNGGAYAHEILSDGAKSFFSDENPNACIIM